MKTTFRRTAALAVLFAVSFSSGRAVAAENSARCQPLAERIARALNLGPGKDGSNFGYANLVPHGTGAHIHMACSHSGQRVLMTFSYPAEFPPASFYDQLTVATGILTGVPAERIRLQAHRCHRAAKRAQGRAHKRSQAARIDCHRSADMSTFWIRGEAGTRELSALSAGSEQNPSTGAPAIPFTPLRVDFRARRAAMQQVVLRQPDLRMSTIRPWTGFDRERVHLVVRS